MIGYNPYKDELYTERMILRLNKNKSFRMVFKKDLSQKFFALIRNITNPEYQFQQNTILSISGLTGTGKSVVMLSLGLMLFPHFSWKNMLFFDQQILDNATKYPQNTLIVRDENPAKAVFGVGSLRTSSQLIVLSETCRKQGLNLAFIEPEFANNEIVKYYLETVDMDLGRRLTRCAIMDSYTKQYMGAILVPVVEETNHDWIMYNQHKDHFINQMKQGDFKGSKLDYKQIAKECIADPEFAKYIKKKEKKAYMVTKFPNYTSGEIEVILAMLDVIERGG